MGSRSLFASSAVCRRWRHVAASDDLWAAAYARRWGSLPKERPTTVPRLRACKVPRPPAPAALWAEAFLQRARAERGAAVCALCGKALAGGDAVARREHGMAHALPYRCMAAGCGKKYARHNRLSKHLKSKQRQLENKEQGDCSVNACSMCEQQFMSEHHLQHHMNSDHLGERKNQISKVGPGRRKKRADLSSVLAITEDEVITERRHRASK